MIDANQIQAQLERAQAALQAGRMAEGWRLLAPLRNAINNYGPALRLYALAAHGVGRIDDAITALKRIAEIEHHPADIMGAIADTYGTAGRHAEAHDHWGAMVARHPNYADAHHNHALAAASAGRHEAAIVAADAGLKHFPGEPRLLGTKALAMKNAGRILDSVAAFEQAVAADPDRALTRQNQAVALLAACRFDESCHAYAEAHRLGMKGAPFFANWAAAALEAGRIDEAEDLYRHALLDDPEYAEARKGLTRLKIEYRGGDAAFSHYELAAGQRPASPKPWLDWVKALIHNRRNEEAREIAERGLVHNPGDRTLRALRSYASGLVGDAPAALEELEVMSRERPGDSGLDALITEIAFLAGRPQRAAGILERRTARDPLDQMAWSQLALAWRLLEDPREHWLCDYDRLVMITDVPSIDGSQASADYAVEVAAMLDPLHVTTAEPGDQTLRGGTQTGGPLFKRPDPAIQRFREAVTLAARDKVAALPDDPAHPFLRRKSLEFGFSGSWSVRLATGGHHVSHVHPEGWMSSAYYARLPAVDEDARLRHEGWIQFGKPPEHLGLDLPPRRIVEPRPGRLVLFPSYMWHGTIPFGTGDRLTAAFDYQPL